MRSQTATTANASTRFGGRGGVGNYLLPGKTAAEKESEVRALEEGRRAREKDIELQVMQALAEPVKAHVRPEEVDD